MANKEFHEKQYLGFNRFGLVRRIVIMAFCFAFYFASGEEAKNGELFFYLGMFILVLSGLALLIQHLETIVKDGKLHLIGPMTFKKVAFDISEIDSIEIAPYSKFLMNRPMFNLHRRGQLRFYTHGNMCVRITLKDGQLIKLGTQRPDALKKALDAHL